MTDETKVQVGTYRGVLIRIDGGSITGGRKSVIDQFPNRDTQTVEDLGLKPRAYSLQIIVAASEQSGLDYFQYRDSLLAALEQSGASDLIHPLHGRIANIVCTTYSLSENFTEFGQSIVTAAFEVSSDTGIPVASVTALSQIAAGNTAVIAASKAALSEEWSLDGGLIGNFTAAVEKANAGVDSIKKATSFIGATAEKINRFTRELGDLTANINSLVSDPIALGDAFSNTMAGIDNLFTGVDATFSTLTGTRNRSTGTSSRSTIATTSATGRSSSASTLISFSGLYGFADDEVRNSGATAGLQQRQKNNDSFNALINSQALGYSYVNAADVPYATVDEIEAAEDALEEQYQFVNESEVAQPVKDALTDLREQTQNFFEEQRLTAAQIIPIYTGVTSARVLSFDYYGTDANGTALAELNSTPDVSFISGDLKVVTA